MSANEYDKATTPETEDPATGLSRPRSCYSWFWVDLTGTCRCAPSFRSSDVIYRKDGTSKTMIIDVPSSFSPPHGVLPATATKSSIVTATAIVAICKSLVLAVELTAFSMGFAGDPQMFWFAFLTHWSLLFSIVYSTLSLVNTIIPVAIARSASSSSTNDDDDDDDNDNNNNNNDGDDDDDDDDGDGDGDGTNENNIDRANDSENNNNNTCNDIVSIRTSITWAFFTLAAVSQMVVTCMYWLLVYDGEASNESILKHGVVFVLVWLDGLVVNKIPVRLRHWFEICFPVLLAYAIWTVLQSPLVFEVGNPYYDDDQIYGVLDWSSSPGFSVILVSGIIFGFSPIAHLILWGLSLLGRRYVSTTDDIVISKSADDDGANNYQNKDDEEEVPV